MRHSFAYLLMLTAAAAGAAGPALAACSDSIASRSACSAELAGRLDGILLVDPSDGRAERRLAGTPWLAPVWEAAPLAATPGDATESAFRMQTSIGQWGAFSARTLDLKLEEAKKLAPEGFKLPRTAPRPDPNLDVWASVAGKGIGEDASREFGSKVGADYRIGRSALVGVAVGMGDKTATGGGAGEGSYTLASYFAAKPLPLLTFETRAGFGESRAGALDKTTEVAHRFIVAQVKSDFLLSQLKISPTLALAHGEDTLKDASTAAAGAVNTLSFGPRVSRPFDIGRGQRLEPFVQVERKLDLDMSEAPALGTGGMASRSERKLGAGLKLDMPNTYLLSVTGDVEEKDAATSPANVRGRLELKVPLR